MSESHSAPKSAALSSVAAEIATKPAPSLRDSHKKGIYAALASAIFMGMTPIFGKQAILQGAGPLAVVALRTLFAALLMLIVLIIFNRKYLYIYPAGLLGCLLAGWTNGVGSLFYYSALGRMDASVGHLLYSLYPLFLLIWLSLDHQSQGKLTMFRLILAIPAVFLLTQAKGGNLDLIGTGQMLIAASLYALHIPINQRVLYDMPAPTVTLYTLIAMSTIVVPVFLIFGDIRLPDSSHVWQAIIGLTLVTFVSRLMLFLGVKHLGGMQTALLGLSELLVAVFFAHLWLGERLSLPQWAGASLLILSLMLVTYEKPIPRRESAASWMRWLRVIGK